ncbi:hypothetical protein FB567DRAFT_633493 [Paraphoma chrysanthemicola]|uniref:C2H2-type domain-containing protein n=1 Tax=Paraphoma chrysanthemicola TaxID=798071 RepID=A0A8K0QW81_9PLEO|nr:hypothetical protein FB567DRAFT_633493 [Paraphoma chrysanthemicola]
MSVQPDGVGFQEESDPFNPSDKADPRRIERFADYKHHNIPERNMDLSIINNRNNCADLEECLRGIGSHLLPCESIYAEPSYTHQASRSLERTRGHGDVALSFLKTSSVGPHVTPEQRSLPHAHDVSVSLDRDCVMVSKHASMADCEPWHSRVIDYTVRPSNCSPGMTREFITGITSVERNLKDLSTCQQVSSEAMSEISGPGQPEFGQLTQNANTTWDYSVTGQDTTDASFPRDMMDHDQNLGPAPGLNSVVMTNSQEAQLLDMPDQIRSAAGPLSPLISGPPFKAANLLQCPQRNCHARFSGKYWQRNLQRHLPLKHGIKVPLYLCEQEGCGKTFIRQDARLKHYRKSHPSISERIASTVQAIKMEGMQHSTSSESSPYLEAWSPALPYVPRESAVDSEDMPSMFSKLTSVHQDLRSNHAQERETFDYEPRVCAESSQRPDARSEHCRIRLRDLVPKLISSHDGQEWTQPTPIVDDMIPTKLDILLPKDRLTSRSVATELRHHSTEERSGQNSRRDSEVVGASVPKWRNIESRKGHHDEVGSSVESHGQTTLEADLLGHNDLEIGPNTHDSPPSEVDTPDESDADERSMTSFPNDPSEQDNMLNMVDKPGRIHLRDWLTTVKTRTHSNSPKVNSSTPVSSETSASKTLAGSKRNADDPPDDDASGKRLRKRRPRIMLDEGQVAEEMYACPFPKKDPRRYTRCWDYAFEKGKFPNLKQHFKRHHLIPFHCPRCGLEFTGDDKDAKRDRHLRQQPQCPRVDLIGRWNGITADQWRRIKKTKQRTITEHDYWMHVYDILFSSQPISGHPYHEDYKTLEVRILIGTTSSAITNNLIPFLTAQGLFANLSDATQTDLTNNLQNLVAAGVNNGFDIAGIEVDRTPPCLPLQELSVSATVPERRDPNDGLFVHASGSLSEESRSPYDMMESVHSDAPTAINKDPHGDPSKDTMAAIQNVQRNDTLGIMNNCSRTCLSNKFTAAQLDFQLSNALSTMTDGLHVRSYNNTLAAIPFIQRNDILTTMNEDPHGAPSDAIIDAEQDTQVGKDSRAWNNDVNPPFDSSTFIDWNSCDQFLFGEYVADGTPVGDIPDIDE